MRLPQLTAARSKALAELGITTEQTMADWSAAHLAAAVNEINDRTRTTTSATSTWLTAAFHQPPPVEPELDELEGWETVGDFSVWYQQRIVDGRVEKRIRAVSHHDPSENHTEIWPGHATESVAPWMRRLVTDDERDPSGASDAVPGPAGPLPTTVPTSVPTVARVMASAPNDVIDLRPIDGRRPVVCDRWQLEVRLDGSIADPVSAELVLESSCGDRIAVEASGDDGVLASPPVECTPGYHEARLHVRNTSTGRLLESLAMPAILVQPSVAD